MTITGVPGGPWREVFGQGKETKKEKKKKNVQWLTVPVCLGKKCFKCPEISSSHGVCLLRW